MRAHDAALAARASAVVCGRLRPLVAEGLVLAFAPLPGEVDIRPLVEELASQQRLCLPRVSGSELLLHRVASLAALHRGAHGIEEPSPGEPLVGAAEIEVVVVPGLAFSPSGARLGRGGGHYDRLLPRLRARRVGVCFEFQVRASLPEEPHDARVHVVVHDGVVHGASGGDGPAGTVG